VQKKSAPSRKGKESGGGLRRCEELERCLSARFFKALSDPNRLQILAHLAGSGRPHTVSELSRCCPVDVSVVSRHLGILRDAGILEARKIGKEVHYRIRASRIAATLRAIAIALEGCPHADCLVGGEEGGDDWS
jgi:ArsR family transcriptional regulator